MSVDIHPSSVVSNSAKIGDNVKIGPFSVIGDDVHLGDNVTIYSHVVLGGHTIVGTGTKIFPFASIGQPPQDLKFSNEPSRLIIGDHNIIREYVTMNPGTQGGGMETKVGNHGLFMIGSHIAHDCYVGDHVIMANNATLAGHVHVGDFAIIGGLSAVHQFIRIGSHAVIGGMSGVEHDVIPFGRVKGERAFLAGLNLIGLERRGFSRDQIKVLQRAFNQLFGDEGTLEQRLETVEQDYSGEDLVMNLVKFAREKTKFPLCQPPKKVA